MEVARKKRLEERATSIYSSHSNKGVTGEKYSQRGTSVIFVQRNNVLGIAAEVVCVCAKFEFEPSPDRVFFSLEPGL